MKCFTRSFGTAAIALAALGIAGCRASAGGGGGASPAAHAASAAHKSSGPTGPGYTSPSKPSGAKLKGGTVYFAQAPGSGPNYIFPMYSAEFCGNANIGQLNMLLYKPLYWYGDNYSPTVDYDQSIGRKPTVSNGGRTFTIRLNKYKWSDGEKVSADGLVFWMNMMEADAASGWCGFAPGYIPQNVKSYRAVNTSTFQITFTKRYNPTWVLYQELAQLYPLPLAWDRTSLSQPVPKSFRHSVGASVKGAGRVYRFLNQQSRHTASWASSPLWRVVDGPFKLQSFTNTQRATLVVNRTYSGSPKPTIAKLIEVPFTSDSNLFDEIKSSGPSALTISELPAQDAPQASSVEAEGYNLNRGAAYGYNALTINLNNPTVGPLFRQLYVRRALAHLVDQPGWIHAILHGAAIPDYGSVPIEPASPLVPAITGANPYPFSIQAAAKLLKANGWDVVPGGTSTCAKPGAGAGECGAGITKGEKLAFTLNYESGVVSAQTEMQNLQAQARRVGINISLEQHTVDSILGDQGPCTPAQAACTRIQAAYWGFFITYVPFYYPSGELLYIKGDGLNSANYGTRRMTKLIQATQTASNANEKAAMARYIKYVEQQEPQIFLPYQVGTFEPAAGTLVSKRLGGYTANAFGDLTPQFWYLTK